MVFHESIVSAMVLAFLFVTFVALTYILLESFRKDDPTIVRVRKITVYGVFLLFVGLLFGIIPARTPVVGVLIVGILAYFVLMWATSQTGQERRLRNP